MLSQSEGTLVDEIYIPPTTVMTEDTLTLMPASSTQFSALIQKIGNADWVRQGQQYIHDDICPFCQQSLNVTAFSRELIQMFDESYQTSLGALSQAAERLAHDCNALAEFERRVAIHAFVNEESQLLTLVKAVNKGFQSLLQ